MSDVPNGYRNTSPAALEPTQDAAQRIPTPDPIAELRRLDGLAPALERIADAFWDGIAPHLGAVRAASETFLTRPQDEWLTALLKAAETLRAVGLEAAVDDVIRGREWGHDGPFYLVRYAALEAARAAAAGDVERANEMLRDGHSFGEHSGRFGRDLAVALALSLDTPARRLAREARASIENTAHGAGFQYCDVVRHFQGRPRVALTPQGRHALDRIEEHRLYPGDSVLKFDDYIPAAPHEDVSESEGSGADRPEPTLDSQPPPPTPPAKVYAFGWGQITDVIKTIDSPNMRSRLKKLNKRFEGPIRTLGQGAEPMVEKGALLEWWNGLEDRVDELDQRQKDVEATVADRHLYGRDGEVVPGIRGEVKGRRGKGKP